jgi:hypothetical protein
MAEQLESAALVLRPQFKQQIFSAPGQLQKGCSAQALFEMRRVGRVQNFFAPDGNSPDRFPPDQRTQMADENFDFRQFGHKTEN